MKIGYVIIALFILGMGVFFYVKNQRGYMKLEINTSFNENIVEQTKQNTFYRKEIVTGPHSQIVLMSIPVGEDIGEETHGDVDQTLIFVQGHGQAIINGVVSEVFPNHLVFVPTGTRHNFKNIGSEDLKLFTVYAPAEHKPGTVEKTKAESK